MEHDERRALVSRARGMGAMAIVAAALCLWFLFQADDGASAFTYYFGERPIGAEGLPFVIGQLTGISPIPGEGGFDLDDVRSRLHLAITFGLTFVVLAILAIRTARRAGGSEPD